MSDRRSFLRGAAAAGVLTALADVRTVFAASIDCVGRSGIGGFQGLSDEYMLAPGVMYLNHASIGTVPRAVHVAHARYLEICESNPHDHIWGDVWEEPREAVRSKAAALIGCGADDVALTHNTTEGFNTLAHGLPLGPGDEVLFSSLNHGGASAPWQHHSQSRGYAVRRFDFPIVDVPSLSDSDVVRLHTDAIRDSTRVLVLPHVDNIVGLRHPVREIVRAARDRGVEFIAVDIAQSLGMTDVDVADWDVDFMAASPHKWVQAPKGTGLLYMKPKHREIVRPLWVTAGQAPQGTIRVYEDYGTRDSPGVLAFGDALDFQRRLGAAGRVERYSAIWQRMRDAVESSPRLRWLSPTNRALSSSVYLIEFTGRRSADVLTAMRESDGVVFRAFRTQGIDGGRISPNVATTDTEIGRFLDIAGT
jgi:selenocysteine lyase/cysteine desulfurase